MKLNDFKVLSDATVQSYRDKMDISHQDKSQSWQYLIQLNTDLPYDDTLSYSLPIEMIRVEDSQEKTRSIVLWRLLQHNTDVETLAGIAQIIDEVVSRLDS